MSYIIFLFFVFIILVFILRIIDETEGKEHVDAIKKDSEYREKMHYSPLKYNRKQMEKLKLRSNIQWENIFKRLKERTEECSVSPTGYQFLG